MRRVLSANFVALVHSLRFWLGCIMMVGTAIYSVIDLYQWKTKDWIQRPVALDDGVGNSLFLIFILLPALGGLFINTDYHDGTIRNKITVGRTRAAVYGANLITVFLVGAVYLAVYLAVYSLIGAPVLGWYERFQDVCAGVPMILLVLFSLSAIATLLATLISSRASLILCAFTALTLLFGAQAINSSLAEPEMVPAYGGYYKDTVMEDGTVKREHLDMDGNPMESGEMPNPGYVPEPMRSVLRAVNDIQPGGQLMELTSGGHWEPDGTLAQTPHWLLTLYALGLSALFTGVGLVLFRRKDLK